MTPEQQLVQQITQLLTNNQLENRQLLLDYSDQFAEICRLANERLARCMDYLEKGRRSEAVFEAHAAPDLLQLSTLLSSPGLKKWHNVCVDLELTMYQPLDSSLIGRLADACLREAELEPLIKEYRRSVYQSDHESSIRLLRQIREKDPANQSWTENLRPLEEAFMERWLVRAEKGLETMDLKDLKIVFNELTHPQRVVMAPEDLLKRLRVALLSERSQDLLIDGQELLKCIRSAMEAEDVPRLEALWERCARLESDEAFLNRPPEWNDVIASSKSFVEKVHERQKRHVQFEKELSEVRDLVMGDGTDAIALRHAWEKLEAWQEPIPDILSLQVKEKLSDIQRRRKARTVRLTSCIAAGVVVIIGVLGWFLWRAKVLGDRSETVAEAERLVVQKDDEHLDQLLETIRRSDSTLYNSPVITEIRTGLEERQHVRNEHKKRYAAYLKTLGDIRDSGFGGDAETIRRTLEDAERVADTSEEKEFLVQWKNEWLTAAARIEAQIDGEYMPVLNGLQTALDGIQSGSGDGLEQEEQALQAVSGELSRLNTVKLAQGSARLRDFHERLKGTVSSRLVDVQRRKDEFSAASKKEQERQLQQRETLARLRQQLYAAMPNMTRYASLLEEFVKTDGNAPESLDFRQLLDHWSEYTGVCTLQGLTVSEDFASPELLPQLNERLDDADPASSSVWRHDLDHAKRLLEANHRLQQSAVLLINIRKDKLYMLRYRRIGETEWRRFYSERRFQSQAKDGQTIYWGDVLWANDDEERQTPIATSNLFNGRNMTTAEYEFRYSREDDDNLAPHIKLLRRIVAETSRSGNVPELFLTEMEKLRTDSEIDPVQGMLVFKRLVNLLSRYCQEELPECHEWARLANNVSTDVPWANHEHPRTAEALAAIKGFWQTLPSLEIYKRRLGWTRRLLAGVLSTGVQCVGSIQLVEDGKRVFRPCTNAVEHWIYIAAGEGGLAHFELLPQKADGSVDVSAAGGTLPAGIPVYSPQAGRGTASLRRMLETEDPAVLKGLRMPQAWPVIMTSLKDN